MLDPKVLEPVSKNFAGEQFLFNQFSVPIEPSVANLLAELRTLRILVYLTFLVCFIIFHPLCNIFSLFQGVSFPIECVTSSNQSPWRV
ncbi:hypothetical protein BDV37DRAFT_235351 [Aspergillus pseudonomiae]|uniref:Uncharacterized protein n=1 Tax=Aspergillus pseudonomiae TaxID=1506151 RepID=A0A5N7DTV5_9EURO|nr:uncharacterized protein BDV37DRAFT_235351 [Aspergillus pseudonomiae]KAE8409900.1 hypothetical protein BDV37DRAFT_235351 [Aspergillus pseudonomiae]